MSATYYGRISLNGDGEDREVGYRNFQPTPPKFSKKDKSVLRPGVVFLPHLTGHHTDESAGNLEGKCHRLKAEFVALSWSRVKSASDAAPDIHENWSVGHFMKDPAIVVGNRSYYSKHVVVAFGFGAMPAIYAARDNKAIRHVTLAAPVADADSLLETFFGARANGSAAANRRSYDENGYVDLPLTAGAPDKPQPPRALRVTQAHIEALRKVPEFSPEVRIAVPCPVTIVHWLGDGNRDSASKLLDRIEAPSKKLRVVYGRSVSSEGAINHEKLWPHILESMQPSSRRPRALPLNTPGK